MFKVGIVLDFVGLTTRMIHPQGAYVRRAKRNLIDHRSRSFTAPLFRPPPMFAPTSPQDRHALFTRLQEEAPDAFKAFGGTAVSGGDTLFTSCKGGGAMRPGTRVSEQDTV